MQPTHLVPPGFWTGLAGIAGAILGGALIAHFGFVSVIGLVLRSGFGVAAMAGLHGVQLWLTALSYKRLLLRAETAPNAGFLFLVRWVREGVGTVLPVTPLGGIIVGIRILCRKGVGMAAVCGATVVDLNVELASQIVFTLLGIMFLAHLVVPSVIAVPILDGLLALLAMATAFAASQWLGLARVAERMAARLGMLARGEDLHRAIIDIYRHPRALASCAALHLLAWLAGALEVWLAMHFLARNVTLTEGLVIESLGQMLRTAGFAVPLALGVQEGGYVLICGMFGIGPDMGLALSLLKRLREIALGIPSIALWFRIEQKLQLARVDA